MREKRLTKAELVEIAKSGDLIARWYALRDERMPATGLRIIASSESMDSGIAEAVVNHPNITASILENIAKHPDYTVRLAATKSLKTSPEVLAALANDRAKVVRASALKNPNCPQVTTSKRSPMEKKLDAIAAAATKKELKPFLDDASAGVQLAAMMRSVELGLMSVQQVMSKMSYRMDVSMTRYWLDHKIASGAVPDKALLETVGAMGAERYLANAIGERIRRYSEEALLTMVSPELPELGWLIASKCDLTPALLAALAQVPSHSVGSFSFGYSGLPAGAIENNGGFISCIPQLIVAQHPDTPAEVIEELRRSRSKHVKAACLARPETTVEQLAKAAKDKGWVVRAAVACHPDTPRELVEDLGSDERPEVRASAARGPKARGALLDALSRDAEPQVRAAVAANPRAGDAVLSRLAKDDEAAVRASAAANKKISKDLLYALSGDKDPEVRAVVAGNRRAPEAAKVMVALVGEG